MTPSRSTEIPWGSPGGPPEGHLANPWKFSGGTHGHPCITSRGPPKAWKVPIGIPSRNVAGTRIHSFQRLPRVFPLGKTLGKSLGSRPPTFPQGFPQGGKQGGCFTPVFPRGENRGALPPPTFPQGFPPLFLRGFLRGKTLGIYPGFSVGFSPCVLQAPPLFLRGESGGAPTFPQGGPHFSPGVSPGGKPCIREQVIPQKDFYRVFLGVFPRGDPGNYKIPSPQRLGASDFHFAPNRPADFSRIVFPFRNSQRKCGPAHGFPLGGALPPRGNTYFSPGGKPWGT